MPDKDQYEDRLRGALSNIKWRRRGQDHVVFKCLSDGQIQAWDDCDKGRKTCKDKGQGNNDVCE